ncbi:MAG: M48 family metalloprotease [Planctomycetota bacterium]|nr:M48 family metalloprotease [Planctomycetota bacterium]
MSNVPLRKELVRQIDAANRHAWILVALQSIFCFLLAWQINWRDVADHPILPVLACAMMYGPILLSVLTLWANNKKRIDHLKEQTRFGQFDKHVLRSLFQDTLRRLNLPDDQIPVYVTASKSLNAGAVRLGLGLFFRSLNGVYLNRQVLHKLEPEEVQDIMGHELGHYYRYYLVSDQFRILTLTLGTLVNIYVVQIANISDAFGPIIIALIASGFWSLSGFHRSRLAQSIEYLCDDMGAQVHGTVVSINGLLKLGADAEMLYAVQRQLLLSRAHTRSGDLAADLDAIEKAIPYGHISPDELKAVAERTLKQRARKNQSVSLTGYLRYLWQSEEAEDARSEMSNQAKMIRLMPRLPWEQLLSDPQRIHLTHDAIAKLVEILEAHPDQVLFHLPDVFGSDNDSHPPIKSRILFLWKNQQSVSTTHDASVL